MTQAAESPKARQASQTLFGETEKRAMPKACTRTRRPLGSGRREIHRAKNADSAGGDDNGPRVEGLVFGHRREGGLEDLTK